VKKGEERGEEEECLDWRIPCYDEMSLNSKKTNID